MRRGVRDDKASYGAAVALVMLGTSVAGASAAPPHRRIQTVKAPAGATDANFTAVSCATSTGCAAVQTLIERFS